MAVEPVDHDQLFKELIRVFFADFMRLFFDKWAKRFDLNQPPNWQSTELHGNPPEGSRHVLDLVAEVQATQAPTPDATEPEQWFVLIHIEIESADRTTSIKSRLPSYYRYLRDTHPQRRVLPIVVYLTVGLEGVGIDTVEDTLFDFSINPLHYLYVGLPGLNAEDYVQGDNWLGVALAALMKIPKERIEALGLEALERIDQAPLTEQERFLLCCCVESYLPVDQAVIEDYRDRMIQRSIGRVSPVNKTSYMQGREEGRVVGREEGREEGRDEGREEGRQTGSLELLEALLESRFGPLTSDVMERLRASSPAELKRLGLALLQAKSLAELGLASDSVQ